jgi:hypothetical protein
MKLNAKLLFNTQASYGLDGLVHQSISNYVEPIADSSAVNLNPVFGPDSYWDSEKPLNPLLMAVCDL